MFHLPEWFKVITILLSIPLVINLSFYLSLCISIYPSIYLSFLEELLRTNVAGGSMFHLPESFKVISLLLSISLYIHLSFYLSLCIFIYLSIYLFFLEELLRTNVAGGSMFHLPESFKVISIPLYIHISIYPSLYLSFSINPSLYLSFYLSSYFPNPPLNSEWPPISTSYSQKITGPKIFAKLAWYS